VQHAQHAQCAPPTRASPPRPQKEDGRDPLVWEDDELTRIRELHARRFDDRQEYLNAKTLAQYLGLTPVEQLHMSVPLHIVFIGFMVRAAAARGARRVAARHTHGWGPPLRPWGLPQQRR
jgi:hypothetical protein